MNHTYLTRLAREAFKAIQIFQKNNDIEGLRHFVHPTTLIEWANCGPFPKAHFEADDLQILASGKRTFSVRFSGENENECWTFELENGRWLVRTISPVNSQAHSYSKAS